MAFPVFETDRSQNVLRRLDMRLVPAPRPGWPYRIVGRVDNKASAP